MLPVSVLGCSFALHGVQQQTTSKAAQRLCGFMLQHMRDARSGMFVWTVSQDGRAVTNNSISIMGQWFAREWQPGRQAAGGLLQQHCVIGNCHMPWI
jgi:hypothetical protein